MTPTQREAVALSITSTPDDEIAARLNIHRATLHRWRGCPWWADALSAEKGRQARDTDAYERRARALLVLQLMRAAQRAEDAGTIMEIADIRAGLAAVQKSGAEKVETVERDFVGRMPAQLRAAVEAWQSGAADLDALDDAALLARGGVR